MLYRILKRMLLPENCCKKQPPHEPDVLFAANRFTVEKYGELSTCLILP